MDIQEKHRITLLNAKCQVVCMAENLMKKMQHGDNIDCCVKKLFTATRLINRLDCYCFPTAAQNIPGEETVTIVSTREAGEFTLTANSSTDPVVISSFDAGETLGLHEIINGLLDGSGLEYTVTEIEEGIFSYSVSTTCEKKDLVVNGPFSLTAFDLVTNPSCTEATTCNNCITDAQLNKMYQVLDSLLQ